MLKKTIKFKDFNDVEHTEDLYFHVSKASVLTASNEAYSEIMKIALDLQERAKFLEDVKEEDFDQSDPFNKNSLLVAEAIRMVARLLDQLIDLSYGVRSSDGLRFVRDDKVLTDFKNSAVYDAFVEQMIGNQDELIEFINQLLANT